MKSFLVSSIQAHSGKSAICLGLGLNYLDKGLKVGYFKPLGINLLGFRGDLVDEDADQAKTTLGLKESIGEISPLTISQDLYRKVLSDSGDLGKKVSESFNKISKGKDVMILDGVDDFMCGRLLGLSDLKVAEMLDSKIILISLYDSIYVLDKILSIVDLIGEVEKKSGRKILAGLIFNQVSLNDVDEIKSLVIPFLESKGVTVFGVLPKDKILKSVPIDWIVEELGGEILTGKENSGKLIESFLVGAMSPTHAMKYFRGRRSTAVVTGGDRSDIQMAALEASITCLILTGNLMPSAPILARADELKIPIILVKDDTLSTVEKMDVLLKRLQVK
ncbi:MAG: phosphotransacetylase family protein, partial [Candidatus Altiarchaeota archaeon]|nr:phosphotransacetylase family protein [Candidatus Altiarchaeota archaeon]